ncbi:hypothetical protein FXO38_23194 [Capsicum annuum]|nr:hypothetical protein FXO38_23194 [Capsicum annuum]
MVVHLHPTNVQPHLFPTILRTPLTGCEELNQLLSKVQSNFLELIPVHGNDSTSPNPSTIQILEYFNLPEGSTCQGDFGNVTNSSPVVCFQSCPSSEPSERASSSAGLSKFTIVRVHSIFGDRDFVIP